jgi:hypothetical protein
MILAAFLALGASSTSSTDTAHAQSSRGQISFVNKTSVTLNFEVDDAVVCPGPVRPNLTCTTQQQPGARTLRARGPQGFSKSREVELKSGSTCTWTVTDDDDDATCGS